jgi:hypothetical protein
MNEEVPEYIDVLIQMQLDGKIKSLAYSFNPDGSCEIFIEPIKEEYNGK